MGAPGHLNGRPPFDGGLGHRACNKDERNVLDVGILVIHGIRHEEKCAPRARHAELPQEALGGLFRHETLRHVLALRQSRRLPLTTGERLRLRRRLSALEDRRSHEVPPGVRLRRVVRHVPKLSARRRVQE